MNEECQTPECGNRVSKPGFKLCLSCWKKANAGSRGVAKNGAPAVGGVKPEVGDTKPDASLLTSTKIAEHFGVKPARINAILGELGWVERGQKGWTATAAAAKLAVQKTHHQSGVPFVMWPAAVLQSGILRAAVSEYLGHDSQTEKTGGQHDPDGFRKKFPANFRATDGHMVRSKAEVLVDNFLYTSGIVHAYERKLPVEEDVYCDFYLPGGKVYVEYWGLENDEKYAARKKRKLEIYAKYKFNLIELGDSEVGNLDDHFPRLLLKFGIAVD
ncbi:MAG: hypothetical protein ACR2P5_04565 [Gammaproteobacteria bacterium]